MYTSVLVRPVAKKKIKKKSSLLWALKSLMRLLRYISLLATRNADWKICEGDGKGERGERKNFACTAVQTMSSQDLKQKLIKAFSYLKKVSCN